MSQPFEIHVTVEGGDLEKFKQVCAEANVKPILLELHTRGGTFSDLQTSSKIQGTWVEVREETDRIAAVLKQHGFNVIRKKIETWPQHPSVPTTENKREMPPGCYLETHLAITAAEADIAELQEVAWEYGAHLSRNVFKRIDDERSVIMMTLRGTQTREGFTYATAALKEELLTLGFEVADPIVEFAIYDSNVRHDESWLEAA